MVGSIRRLDCRYKSGCMRERTPLYGWRTSARRARARTRRHGDASGGAWYLTCACSHAHERQQPATQWISPCVLKATSKQQLFVRYSSTVPADSTAPSFAPPGGPDTHTHTHTYNHACMHAVRVRCVRAFLFVFFCFSLNFDFLLEIGIDGPRNSRGRARRHPDASWDVRVFGTPSLARANVPFRDCARSSLSWSCGSSCGCCGGRPPTGDARRHAA